jgi:uncharacterized protein YbjQ (UPF0145 family)
MIVVTTPSMEGRRITQYLGLVSGDAILGANIFKDLFAGIRDIVGVDLDYETITMGSGGGMLMVSASGTAVVIED